MYVPPLAQFVAAAVVSMAEETQPLAPPRSWSGEEQLESAGGLRVS